MEMLAFYVVFIFNLNWTKLFFYTTTSFLGFNLGSFKPKFTTQPTVSTVHKYIGCDYRAFQV